MAKANEGAEPQRHRKQKEGGEEKGREKAAEQKVGKCQEPPEIRIYKKK